MLPLISYVIAWSAFTVWKKAKNYFRYENISSNQFTELSIVKEALISRNFFKYRRESKIL